MSCSLPCPLARSISADSYHLFREIKLHLKEGIKSKAVQIKGSADACLFISRLPSSLSNEELKLNLYQLFSEIGVILSVKVYRNPKQEALAFIQFMHYNDAQIAQMILQNALFYNQRMHIEKSIMNTRLFLCKFPYPKSEENFQEFSSIVSQFGTIKSINLYPNKRIAFISYQYREDAERAMYTLKNEYGWIVDWAKQTKKNINKAPSTVYIGNLSQWITETILMEKLSEYGDIVDLKLHSSNGKPNKAIVCFDSNASANQVIKSLNGEMFYDSNLIVGHV